MVVSAYDAYRTVVSLYQKRISLYQKRRFTKNLS